MYIDYIAIGIFLIGSIFFVSAAYITSWLLREDQPTATKSTTYECGIPSFHPAWIQYKTPFYIFIIMFLIFDVEVVFLIPWAVILKEFKIIGLIEGIIFVIILIVGLIYGYLTGALRWVKE